MKQLLEAAEDLAIIINHCAKAEYSLDDAYELRRLAEVLKQEAQTIAECCS